MGLVTFLLRTLLVAGVSMLLVGCGAGLITGLSASQNNGTSTESQPPELSLSPILPLVPAANTIRSVVVTNAQIPASARLRVTIEAAGVLVDQPLAAVSGQGGSTAISFTLETAAIIAAVGDATVADIEGRLAVLVDDVAIAASVAVLLARQPAAQLELPAGQQQLLLSPFGQAVTIRLAGLRSLDPNNLEMMVETRDPAQTGGGGPSTVLVRPCTNLTVVATGVEGEALVNAIAPGNPFPDRASVFVRDAVSGESTSVEVYYRPEITLALPSQGVTTGGNLVSLIGTALVPYDFTQSPPSLSYAAVELSFAKGGRVVTLAREDFREELSAGDRLVFRMPASPDGRPGQVDIVLRVQFEGVEAQIVASQVFLFANPDPFFGPRGAVLDQQPVAVAPIALDAAPSDSDAPDFAVLTEEGGVGFLQLLLAQENGMFLRFGARRQIGNHEVAAERNPFDLCTADFDGDEVPDMFIVNGGEGGSAQHHVVLGQARPATPLGAVHRIPGVAGMGRCRTADIDADGLLDVVLVPGPGAPPGLPPRVLLAQPIGVGQPAFSDPIPVPVRDFAYQAIEVADFDGNGTQDIAVVDGAQLMLDVAFGDGAGGFPPQDVFSLDFTVPSYTADVGSPAIGLHACGNGPWQSLGLVLGGDNDGVGFDPDPVIAVLHQNPARTFASPVLADVQTMGPDPVSVSIVANLDDTSSPEVELVSAIRDDPSPGSLVSNAVFRFIGSQFFPVSGGVEIGGEQPRKFRALHFGRAFPATELSGEAKAVFAVHESEIDGARELRLSTLLIFNAGQTPTLLPPDAGAVWNNPVRGIVGGNWGAIAVAAPGSVRDLALARSDGIDLLENDGFGGLPRPSSSLSSPGLLPQTMTLVPADPGEVEQLAFFDQASRLHVWRPDTMIGPQSSRSSGELRLASPNSQLQTAVLNDDTRIEIVDVDGDGVLDVVGLLKFDVASVGEDDALLVLMRGKAVSLATELPFHEPSVVLTVHGKAASIALADFAATTSGLPRQLELALAVPEPAVPGGLDGDHVRFFRYVAGATPSEDRFEPSARASGPQVLLAGNRPTRLVADDFDRDGLIDLLVAADGDDTLRLFRNVALPTAGSQDVDVGAFLEALSSPRPLPAGYPIELRLGDVNGDGAIDAIVAVEDIVSSTSELTTAVAFYLSEEPGVLGDPEFVSPTRLGNRDAEMALDLGDWNRDGVLDLFLGWDTTGPNDRNVRVLFGGSR